MVEQVSISAEETTAQAPVQEEQQVESSRPEGLPEKFESVEALAKSYAELESKLGQPKEEAKEEAKAEPTNDLEIADKAVESAGLNMEALTQEYAENGELGEQSYEALAKAGIPKETVDQFIAGQQAVAAQQQNEIKSLVGGDDAYTEMTAWAQQNLTPAEVDAYNQAVNAGNMETIKLAVTGLQARYTAANGTDPKLLSGKAAPTSQGGYESWAQVQVDMGDPRYAKDPAFQAEVQEKLANSNL